MTFINTSTTDTEQEEARRKVDVNDVLVIRASELMDDNPYSSRQLRGVFRRAALESFKRGDPESNGFWYAPVSGRAYQLRGPEEIDWSSFGAR